MVALRRIPDQHIQRLPSESICEEGEYDERYRCVATQEHDGVLEVP